ncbi:MAG: hypothetical protein M0P64_00210 [Candidatus Pacebacteria bacterium]|jgi:hypothetical protein|nr:hypothetical protein [Candidatus Paceibacterota bacterium]
MGTQEEVINRGLGEVRRYGVVVLLALLLLNGVVLWALHWVESNDLRTELSNYAATLPVPDITKPEQTINLPEDIIALRTQGETRVGFYETSIGDQDFLVYSDPNKHYVLMKSESGIQRETRSFAFALAGLYLGELVFLLGWWFFIRTKVREMFEAI